MVQRIRLLAVAAALMILVSACAGTTTGSGSSASCTAALSFRGHLYAATSLRTHPPYDQVGRISAAHMHGIGTGVFPPCRDTNHSADQALSVRVARIDGVDPGTAVAVLPRGDVFVKSFTAILAVLASTRGIRRDESS